MKLTRRDFLKGGTVTAVALAVGLKPKAAQMPDTLMGWPVIFGDAVSPLRENAIILGDFGGYLVPQRIAAKLRAPEFTGGVRMHRATLNVSPELVQADEDWEEWHQELRGALSARMMDAAKDVDFLLTGGHDLQPIGILGPPEREA